MGISCNGICNRYKIAKPNGTGRYSAGQKRCNLCAIFVQWEGPFCPCCGYRLRSKPRNGKYKEKYYETIRKNEGAIIEIIMCRGICERFKAKWFLHTDRYANGQKRCNECGIFISWDGRHCPCCGMMLRTKPRSKAYKQKFNLKLQSK